MPTHSSIPDTFQFAALVVLLAIGIPALQAQVKFTNPVRITQRDGLPDNRVTCMAQDGNGFMWFGTFQGLCRFDGSVVKVFQNVPGNSTSLSQNQVNSLFYDSENNCLWIGTVNGLNVLDLRTDKFRIYFHDPNDQHSLTGNEIGRSIFKDRQGIVWIGLARKGFLRYNRAADNFDRFAYPLSASDVGERLHRASFISRILQDTHNDSILWMATGSGLLKFNKYSVGFVRYYTDLGDKEANIKINGNYNLYQHKDGRLFMGAYGGFLNIFDPIRETFRQVNPTLDPSRFVTGKGVVYEIMAKSEKELWVTTAQGLSVYDLEKDAITSEMLNDPNYNTIYRASYQDKSNRIWGRSTFGGVRIYDPLNEQFQHFPLQGASARFVPIKVLEAPVRNQLYVNVAGGKGLYLLDRKTNRWTLIPTPPGFLKNNAEFAGRGMIFLRDGRLLIVEESTLFTLSNDAKSLVRFPLQPDGKGARFMDALQDHQGRVWVTSVDGGLFRLDLVNGTSKVFSDELLDTAQKGQALSIGAIFEDSHQNIWIDASEGFSMYDSQRDSFINLRYSPGRTNVFRHISGLLRTIRGIFLLEAVQRMVSALPIQKTREKASSAS